MENLDFTFGKVNKLLFQTRIADSLSTNLVHSIQNDLYPNTTKIPNPSNYLHETSLLKKTDNLLILSLYVTTGSYVPRLRLGPKMSRSTNSVYLSPITDSVTTLALQRSLSSINIFLKKSIKRYFSFYTYAVSPDVIKKSPSRVFIPELKFATRGFYSTANNTLPLKTPLFATELALNSNKGLLNFHYTNLLPLPINRLGSPISIRSRKFLKPQSKLQLISLQAATTAAIRPRLDIKRVTRAQSTNQATSTQVKFTPLSNLKNRILKRRKSSQ